MAEGVGFRTTEFALSLTKKAALEIVSSAAIECTVTVIRNPAKSHLKPLVT